MIIDSQTINNFKRYCLNDEIDKTEDSSRGFRKCQILWSLETAEIADFQEMLTVVPDLEVFRIFSVNI